MGYAWLSTAARTGEILTDLPLLTSDPVKQTVGRYETINAQLPVHAEDAPPDWLRATQPGAAHLILVADNPNDPAHGIPLIGYRIVRRTRTPGDQIALTLATLEQYADVRYVGDVLYTGVGQNSIVADLVSKWIYDTPTVHGIPIRVQYTTAGVGKLRDRLYEDASDKTIYSVLTDLSGVIGGIEWYIGWEWQSAPERITPVLYVGDRVGSVGAPGLQPSVTFEMPGPVSDYAIIEDYGQGKGANDIMAVSSGQGDARPQSPRQTAPSDEMPTIEYRWTPSTSITEIPTLVDHAQAALAVMAQGNVSIALKADATDAPRVGADWFLGDDVGYSLGGLNPDGTDIIPSLPGGYKGVARVAGFELDVDAPTPQVTPILVKQGADVG